MAMRNPPGNGRRSKHRGLDGSVPGLPYAHYRRPTTPPMGSPRPRVGGYHQDLYGWSMAGEYHPNWNAPAVQIDEYVTDPDWESHQVPHPCQERLLRPFPQREAVEPAFQYEQARELDTFFLKVMEIQYRPHREREVMPSMADLFMEHFGGLQTDLEEIQDGNGLGDPDLPPQDPMAKGLPKAEDIADALTQLRQVFPEDHPDIVRLEAAMQMLTYPTGGLDMPIEGGVGMGVEIGGNPYGHSVTEQGDAMYRRHEAVIEQPFGLPSPGFGGVDEMCESADMGRGLEAMLSESMSEQTQLGGLDQFIEQKGLLEDLPAETMDQEILPDAGGADPMADVAAYDETLAMDEIGLALDQVMELRYEPEQMEQDPFAMAQDIFNQQMQFMANPLMMPGM